jgi:hypothetical protein
MSHAIISNLLKNHDFKTGMTSAYLGLGKSRADPSGWAPNAENCG